MASGERCRVLIVGDRCRDPVACVRRGMVPPFHPNSSPEPTYYHLGLDEGLWTLSKPRGSKGKLVMVESYRNYQEARSGAIARAKADPSGAFLTISTVVKFRRCRESYEFPAHS